MKTSYLVILLLVGCAGAPEAQPFDVPSHDLAAALTETISCVATATPEVDLAFRLEYTATRMGDGWVVNCAATGDGQEAFNTQLYRAGDKLTGACWVVLDFDGQNNGGGFSFVPEPGAVFARYNPDSATRGFGGWHMQCTKGTP